MDRVKALIVFCEGPHDVAFCRLVFKYCFGIGKVEWKFNEYPSPLNNQFNKCMEKHAKQDMSLDMAHKFFLPDWTLYDEKEPILVLLFNTGGKERIENSKTFLADFLPLLDQAEILPHGATKFLSEVKYLFVYDSDHQSPRHIFQSCGKRYSQIGDINFITAEFSESENNPMSAVSENKAVYAWCEPQSKKGTLEDILLPLYRDQNRDLIEKSEKFIDGCFSWETDHTKEKRKFAERAKRKKAIITSAGLVARENGNLPPFSREARIEAGYLHRRLQMGENLS